MTMSNDRDWLKLAAVVALFVAIAVCCSWCAVHAATCTPDPLATPTPVVAWTQNADADLAGYSLYYREPGGTFQRLLDFPCQWYDLDEDGITDTRWCRGPDLGAPLQRYCAACAPLTSYEFAVKAYDLAGNASLLSAALPICFSPICVRGGPPCN